MEAADGFVVAANQRLDFPNTLEQCARFLGALTVARPIQRRAVVAQCLGVCVQRSRAIPSAHDPVQRLGVVGALSRLEGELADQLVEPICVDDFQRFANRGMCDTPLRV